MIVAKRCLQAPVIKRIGLAFQDAPQILAYIAGHPAIRLVAHFSVEICFASQIIFLRVGLNITMMRHGIAHQSASSAPKNRPWQGSNTTH